MLIQALLSKDKDRLKKALSVSLPSKLMTVDLDHQDKTITYLGKIVSKEEFEEILNEAAKEFQVKLVVMNYFQNEDQLDNRSNCFASDKTLNSVIWDFNFRIFGEPLE